MQRLPERTDLVLVIAAGGAVGGSMRLGLNTVVPDSARGFPWSTFTENVVGSALLAALTVYLVEVWRPGRYLRPFMAVGMLGGFTTFSTYSNETRQLLQDGQAVTAMLYCFGTVAAGLLAVLVGLALARRASGVARAER